jgi:hypothetical protein
MKNAYAAPKLKLHKTIVTRFTKSSSAKAFGSTSILNTSSRGGAGFPV